MKHVTRPNEEPRQTVLPAWEAGARVIVAWHRKEYDATVVRVGRRMYVVETDEPYNREGDRRMSRLWFEISDERSPDA